MSDPGFQYTTWAARFPALAVKAGTVLPGLLYQEALLIPEGSQITNNCALVAAQAIVMMNLLVAHLTFLALRDDGAVGRVESATEGSVTAALAYPTDGGTTQAWYAQSTYGAELWRMMASYRLGRYVPGPAVIGRPGLGLSIVPPVVQIGGPWGIFGGGWNNG